MKDQYRIAEITIDGFRKLFHFKLTMRDFMVMVGANGVGKSTVLDVFSVLSSMAAGKMDEKITELGGVAGMLTRGKSNKISFCLDMTVPNHNPLEYSIAVNPTGNGYAISREKLCQANDEKIHKTPFLHIDSSNNDIRYFEPDVEGQGRLTRPTWDHNPLESSLSQVPKMFRQPESLRRILSTAAHYHVLDVGERAPVKLPQSMKPANMPGNNGEDLVPYLYYMRESDPARFQTILDTLHAAFPDFESLNFPPIASGMLTLAWKSKTFEKPFYANELSEGTLRFLWLASLLQCPALPMLTMIDEPEVSLHPELLSLLVDLMREASDRTQLLIATHSDSLIRFLNPGEVLVMDVDEQGCTAARWADEMDIDAWLDEYSMDDIWKMGRIGGRA